MTIPGFQSLMLPLLKIASDEADHNHAEVRDSLAVHFEISDSEKKEMLSSGKQARFDNRVAWAIVYMRRAGLIENSSRGIFHITVQGLDLLKTNPDKIDIKLLKQLNPAVRDWGKNSDQPIDNERDMIITTEKRDELLSLFQEFVKSYLLTPEGEKHSAYYQRAHEESRKNIENIKFRFDQGEDVTNEILAKLLPYSDIPSNRENGYWISIAPAFFTDVKIKYEAAGLRKDGWSEVANAILNFVFRCDEQPDQLSKACSEFSESPYSKGFQTGTLTPILNALRPDKFVLINNKSRRVLNYFTDKSYIQSLSEYPKANGTALSLIRDVEEDFQILSKKNLLAVDLFDEFSHWLIAIKHHTLGSTAYWKIAPGENAWNWDACHEGGFIAIGWEEMGDVSNLSKSQFNSRRDDLLKEHPDWNKIGVEQVWKFAHIKEGDRIIANKGITEVLGIGTTTGPYYFVEGLRHGHRIPVEWEDLTPRRINKPGWKRTLIELAQAEFDSIYTSIPIDIYKIFKDREEAEWAFALMRETLNRLGINNSDDERFAITCPSGGTAIHLNFGQWLVLGFNSKDIGANRIEMALLADQTGLFSKFESFKFAQGENELDIKLYKFPIELVNSKASDLRRTYDKSLQYIAEKFGSWQATPWRKNNIREISDVLFDDSKLGYVLDQNFKINIWWVNQGSTIDEEKKGYLWAPTKTEKGRSIYHWDNLLEVKQGDIILHYANGYLNYVSKVLTSAEKTKNPHSKRSVEWAEDGNAIRVSYFDLTPPIALSKFSQSVLELDIKQGPFNRNGGINQGYLFKLTPEALNIIQNSQKETTWPEFARILLNRPAWIFQSNPKYYNIEGALEVLTEMNFLVNQYPNQIRAGDTVYIWKSGKEGGIIAVGTILTNPTMMSMESKMDDFVIDETKFVSDALRVRVRIDHKLPEIQRIGRENFKNHPLLSSMEIVNFANATNFKVKTEHVQSLHDLVFGNSLEPAINAEYRLDQCSEDTGLRLDTLESWVRAIERKGQGAGDLGVLVDHSGGIEDVSEEIVSAIGANKAAGTQARGCLAATVDASLVVVSNDDVYGGQVWIRPRSFIGSEDTFSLTYLDMNGQTQTANATVPAATHRGEMILAEMVTESSRAKKVLTVTPSGNYSYDILLGMGEADHLYNLPELVAVGILAHIRLTATPETGLVDLIKESQTAFLGAFRIGENLEFSDVQRFLQNYFDPTADESVGRALKGIDEIVSLQVTGGGQAAVKNGDKILVEEDSRIEAGLINIVVDD